MNDIQLFSNDEFGSIRATVIDEEPWFVAADVASALEYGAAAKLTRNLFDDEKGVHIVDTPGGNQQVSIISLSGLFHAMNMRRTGVIKNKENRDRVERFQRWVNHEVLPAIVKDGGYMVAIDETPEQTMARALLIAQDTIDRSNRQLAHERTRNAALLEHNATLVPKAQFYDNLMDSDGLLSVRDAAKILKSYDPTIGEKRLRQNLRDDCMVEKRTTKATSVAIERGYMRERPFSFKHSDGHETFDHYGCLTPKGLDWCKRRYCDQHMFDFQ